MSKPVHQSHCTNLFDFDTSCASFGTMIFTTCFSALCVAQSTRNGARITGAMIAASVLCVLIAPLMIALLRQLVE